MSANCEKHNRFYVTVTNKEQCTRKRREKKKHTTNDKSCVARVMLMAKMVKRQQDTTRYIEMIRCKWMVENSLLEFFA